MGENFIKFVMNRVKNNFGIVFVMTFMRRKATTFFEKHFHKFII